jgi:outer membrane protein W
MKASVQLNSAIMATGDYYFNSNKFRPFAGLGLGLYSIAGTKIESSMGGVTATAEIEGSSSFAALLRAGFDFSHLRVTASYNIAFSDPSFSFLGITVGFYIGGGRK